MSETKLLPCPFCGSEAEMVVAHHVFKNPYVVICKSKECLASKGNFSETKEEAINAWNTRKPMERIVERLEEEKGCVEDYSTPEDRRLVRHWNNCVDVCKEVVKVGGVDGGLL